MSDQLSPAVLPLARELFGEVADTLGMELLPRVCEENVRRVLEKSKVRSAELGIHGNTIPPRILLPIVRSASVCEDDVVASYLAGVLCSARTPNARDDRAIAALKIIDGLSTYALRAHCIIYASLLRQKDGKLSAVEKWLTEGRGLTLLLDEGDLQKQMEFLPNEDPDIILSHAFVNLSANDLCMQGVRSLVLAKETVKSRFMHPTLRGVELFCWGTGLGQLGPSAYFANQTAKADIERFSITPRTLKLGHTSWLEV
jgi:hypothetical protein